MGGIKISASGVSPKWVKSNERRKKEERERRAKVGNNNGHYVRLNQLLKFWKGTGQDRDRQGREWAGVGGMNFTGAGIRGCVVH